MACSRLGSNTFIVKAWQAVQWHPTNSGQADTSMGLT